MAIRLISLQVEKTEPSGETLQNVSTHRSADLLLLEVLGTKVIPATSVMSIHQEEFLSLHSDETK